MAFIPENSADAVELEAIVDRHGLGAVLAALANICGEKAEHIRVNWQDRETAKPWDSAAKKLASTCAKIEV